MKNSNKVYVDDPASGVVFWFRNDLRLHDQVALQHAVARARQQGAWLLPVYVNDTDVQTNTLWGFARTSVRRRAWTQMALQDLSDQLAQLGSPLCILMGQPAALLAELVRRLDMPLLVCEDIAAPFEQSQIGALRHAGAQVQTVWQSTLMDAASLPFAPAQVPDMFTAFRQSVERVSVPPAEPLTALGALPAPPDVHRLLQDMPVLDCVASSPLPDDARSSFPMAHAAFHGGERAALAHLAHYCALGLPHSYKQTRNGLQGVGYSTKWSPWLATGALSARQAWAAIASFERNHGATDSTYWIKFELLWRDHFRWLHIKHGARLYQSQGLRQGTSSAHNQTAFVCWQQGQTGDALIDAGMRELAATGYVSNRMRQNLASFLIHDLGCDWRAGAAWFEAHLIDYDVYSNQGNWLYLSGKGTDPRGSRRFNTAKQAADHDPLGTYRALWAASTCPI